MLQYDEAVLAARLRALSPAKRAAFATACAERLFPHWVAYATHCRLDLDTLRAGLDAVLAARSGDMPDPREIARLRNACLALVPDEDDLPFELSAPAQNAAIAVVYALSCWESGDLQDAVWAALNGYEAADFLAREEVDLDPNDRSTEVVLLAHPLVQRELAQQGEDLARLLWSNGG